MPATHTSRRKKPGLISGTATKVAALATAIGAKIGDTVREPASQIASFVHDTAQHLPLIGSTPKRAKRKTASAKPSPATAKTKRARSAVRATRRARPRSA